MPLTVKIKNVITTANLHQYIDITKFRRYTWGTYDLEYYGGRCGYIKDDKIRGRVTVFLSGKTISIGAKSIHESIVQLQYAVEILAREKFIRRIKVQAKVQNMVATANLASKIDLARMAMTLTKFTLDPEQFPAAIYRSPYGPTCLIFASGKVIIAGAKSKKQIIDTESLLQNLLKQFFINNNVKD